MSEAPAGDEIPDLFARALELEGEERRRFVATLTAHDPALGAAILRLLDRADDPDSPLDRSPWGVFAEAVAPPANPPERIGPYRIERELGVEPETLTKHGAGSEILTGERN